MSDQRGFGGVADEDRLPWLEPVEEDYADHGVSAGRLIAGLVVALCAIGLIVGGVYWLKQRMTGGDGSGEPVTITAQQGPIKVKPSEPGGMQVKGQGDSSYAASEGADPNARIDLSAVPEAPIAKPEKAPAPQPAAQQPAPAPTWPAKPTAAPQPTQVARAPAPAPAKPAPAPAKTETAPAAAPVSGGAGQIQLGALDSQAKAEAAWKTLSGRYAYLGALSHSVVKAEVNGKTYYRLRAGGSGASAICSKLKVAGEACTVVG
jgi:hypothetical protein